MVSVDPASDGLKPNENGYTCRNCGEVYDFSNCVTTGSIDVSGLDIERICPTVDSGFVIHVSGGPDV